MRLFSNGKLRRCGSCSEKVFEPQYKYNELSTRVTCASRTGFYIHGDVLNCINTVCYVFRPAGSCTNSVPYVLDQSKLHEHNPSCALSSIALLKHHYYVFNAAVPYINTTIYVLSFAVVANLSQVVGSTDAILDMFNPAVSCLNTVCSQELRDP